MAKFLFSLLIISILLFGCETEKNVEIVVDNPSELDFSFSLKEEAYTVSALSKTTLKLKEGVYFLWIQNEIGDTLLNDSIYIFSNGLLNPTKSTYVVWNDLYLENFDEYEQIARSALNIQDSIFINDKEYNDVDFDVYENQVFIEKTWDFGVFEDWPEEIDLYSKSTVKKSKIYRLADLEEEWGYWGTFDFNDYTEEEFQQLLDSLLNEADLEIETTAVN